MARQDLPPGTLLQSEIVQLQPVLDLRHRLYKALEMAKGQQRDACVKAMAAKDLPFW